MQLTVVSPYGPTGASTRVRVYDWLRHLGWQAQRYEYLGAGSSHPGVLVRSPLGAVAAERRLRGLAGSAVDTLLLQREASPISRGALEVSILRAARHGVFDFDDALQWDHGQGGVARRIAPKARKCLAAVRAADRVIAGNDVLADWASAWSDDVVVIPSCVEPSDYLIKHDYQLNDPPIIGWLGSPTAEPHLSIAAPGLLEAHRRIGARLVVVSGGQASLGALDAMAERRPWRLDTVASQMASWDVAIAPLRDSALARGKCAYKLLQYGAAALPVLGSPVGVNARVLSGFGGGAVDPGSWADALLGLLEDETVRRAAGVQARSHVCELWSFAAWSSRWVDALSPAA